MNQYRDSLLFRYMTWSTIVGVSCFALVAVFLPGRAFTLMTLVSFISFISQMAVLLSCTGKDESCYTSSRIFIIVLAYSVLMALLMMSISYIHSGDSFMFSKGDAFFYHRKALLIADLGLDTGLRYIINNYPFDDWGAMMLTSLAYSIIPSKLFVNVIYLLLGALGSVFLFLTAKSYMSAQYAFTASLAFSTSSFWIFFHCSLLKETAFITAVLAAMYFACRFAEDKSVSALVSAALCIIAILFFRPAVAGFMLIAMLFSFALSNRKNAVGVFMIAAAALLCWISFDYMASSIERYTGGDIENVISYRSNSSYSGLFNYLTSFFGAFAGPFPTYTSPDPEMPRYIQFYSSGLTLKLFLVLPFWTGAWFILKDRKDDMAVLLTFILLEMLATGAICASLELRKVLPHIPFMFLVSFYGMYRLEQKGYRDVPLQKLSFAASIVIVILWNIVKIK